MRKTHACTMQRPVPARAPHARARSVQHTDENKTEQHRIHTRAMRSRLKALRVWLAWCDGTGATHETDHGKRAELQRARDGRKLNSWLVWGLSQSEGDRDRASIHPCLPDAARVGGRSRALDNEKLTFSSMFKKQKTDSVK